MIYDYSIDETILRLLFDIPSLGYLELKRNVESLLGRHLSSETFNKHMMRLFNQGWMSRLDSHKRGKPVKYSLTMSGRKRYSLSLLASPNAKDIAHLYSLILFFEFKYPSANSHLINSTKELEDILQEQKLTLQDLRIDEEETRNTSEHREVTLTMFEGSLDFFIDEVMAERKQLLQDPQIPVRLKEYISILDDTEVDLEESRLEELIRFLYRRKHRYTPPNELSHIVYRPIAGIRIDKWNFTYEGLANSPEYQIWIPGFSARDIYEKEKSRLGKDALGVITKGVTALCDVGLLREDMKFRGEPRFVHSDYMLRKLLSDYHIIFKKYLDLMRNHVWLHRAPTKIEKEWIRDFNSNGQQILDNLATERWRRRSMNLQAGRKLTENLRERQKEMQLTFRYFVQENLSILETYHWLHDIMGITLPPLHKEFLKLSSTGGVKAAS